MPAVEGLIALSPRRRAARGALQPKLTGESLFMTYFYFFAGRAKVKIMSPVAYSTYWRPSSK